MDYQTKRAAIGVRARAYALGRAIDTLGRAMDRTQPGHISRAVTALILGADCFVRAEWDLETFDRLGGTL